MEYQPCCASGNKKAAKVEAAVACLQELAALPGNLPVPPRPQRLPPPMAVTSGAPRPVARLPSLPLQPKPVRPLMTLQPRPRFASLQAYRPPHPAQLPVAAALAEPPPPGVDVSDFTSDVFDDLEKFESSVLQVSANRPPASSVTENADAEHRRDDAAESCEAQFEGNAETRGSFSLLGDKPEGLADGGGEYADDTEYDGTSEGYNEFPGSGRPRFPGQPLVRGAAHIFGGNFENIPNAGFGGPSERFYPALLDFADDTIGDDRPGIFGKYREGILGNYHEGVDEAYDDYNEPYDDFFEPCEHFEPWEEDFQSDTCFQNPVGFGPRGMVPPRPFQQPFHVRTPRPPLIARGPSRPPPWLGKRFPRDPPLERFPRPSFDAPLCLRGPAPLPRGMFRPRLRPPVRPL